MRDSNTSKRFLIPRHVVDMVWLNQRILERIDSVLVIYSIVRDTSVCSIRES